METDYKSIEKLAALLEELKTHPTIEVEEETINFNKEYIEFLDWDDIKTETKEQRGITISDKLKHYAYTSGCIIDWTYSQGEDWLYGGFKLSTLDNLALPTHFWRNHDYKPKTAEEAEFMEDLVYFNRSGHGDDGTFSCFHRTNDFANQVYFYDDRRYWKMPLNLDEYFEKMLQYKAVAAWQYFFINPEEIIEKTKDLDAENWPVTFAYRLGSIPKPKAILFWMDRTIKLFPKLFPEVDISVLKENKDNFENLL